MISISIEQFIALITATLAIITGTVIWIFYNLEQISILLSWLYRVFSWASRRLRNKAIESQIQSKINAASEAIEAQVNDVMPHPVKIEHLNSGTEYATFQNGQVVVRLRNEFDDARNMVAATMLYVQTGLLRESRNQIDNALQKAIDIKVAWSIVRAHADSNLNNYFLTNVYSPIVGENKSVEVYCRKLEELDSRGYFTRMHLRELRDVGQKTGGMLPAEKLKEETRLFTNYLHVIATSKPKKKYPLQFFGNVIKIGVILIAREETLEAYGLLLHKRWLKKKIEKGAETIYLLGRGHENVNLACTLAQWGQKEGLLDIIKTQRYSISSKAREPIRSVVIACRPNLAKTNISIETEEEVRDALKLHIPEIANGQVDILDIVREPGVQSNVIINSTTNSNSSLIGLTREHKQRMVDLIEDLHEFVRLIPWADDPEIFILNCLGISHTNVDSVNINQQQKLAIVTVTDSSVAARAIGTQGRNVRLAEKTVGLNIKINFKQ